MSGEYQFRMFMNESGEVDFIRKSCQTQLAADIGPEDVVIPVVDLLSMYGGDISGLVTKRFTRRTRIADVLVTAVGDGLSRTLVVPDYWADNPVTVLVDGSPVGFTFTGNQLTLDDPPSLSSEVTVTVEIQGITYPRLAGDPEVSRNTTPLVLGDDYSIVEEPLSTRINLVTPLAQGDVLGVTLTYLSSGATVAWINNERIEYYGVDLDRNLLLQCRRGTNVTAKRSHPEGTVLWDGSNRQSAVEQARLTGINYLAPELGAELRNFLSQQCP